jgi:Wzt C-terminal domain
VDSKKLVIRTTKIIDRDGKQVRGVHEDKDYMIVITVEALEPVKNVSVGYNIKTPEGLTVYGTSTALSGHFTDFEEGHISDFKFTLRSTLALGTYYLSAGAAETLTPEDEIHNYVMRDFVHDAFMFVVISKIDAGIADLKSELVSFKIIEEADGHQS